MITGGTEKSGGRTMINEFGSGSPTHASYRIVSGEDDVNTAWEGFTASDDCQSTGDAARYAFRAGWLAGKEAER